MPTYTQAAELKTCDMPRIDSSKHLELPTFADISEELMGFFPTLFSNSKRNNKMNGTLAFF